MLQNWEHDWVWFRELSLSLIVDVPEMSGDS